MEFLFYSRIQNLRTACLIVIPLVVLLKKVLTEDHSFMLTKYNFMMADKIFKLVS